MYETFNQLELKKYTRHIIDSIGICDSIKNSHPEHFEFFLFLFKRHVNYPKKFLNMSDISIKRNPHFKENLEVIILKNDGSFDNVSVMNKCISGDGGSFNNLYRAMRNSIYSQISEFKKQNPNQCNSCASKDNLEVDHVSPGFIQLVDMFIKNTSITIPNTFDDNEYHSKVFKKRDQQFENDWNNFHFQNASLQFLCKKCHSKKPVTRINSSLQTIKYLDFDSSRAKEYDETYLFQEFLTCESFTIQTPICKETLFEISKTDQYLKQTDSVKSNFLALLNTVKGDTLTVKYTQKNEGRFWGYPDINALPRWIKKTILHKEYKDFDISNAHPTILLMLCRKHKIKADNLEYYCKNRDQILVDIVKKYDVSNKTAKQLFHIINFGGSFSTWKIQNELKDVVSPESFDFVVKYSNELKSIKNKLCIFPEYKRFLDYAQQIKKKKTPIQNQNHDLDLDQDCDIVVTPLLPFSQVDLYSSAFSLILQHYEALYLKLAIKFLDSNKFIPGHDGFYIHVSRFEQIDNFLANLNKYVTDNPIILCESDNSFIVFAEKKMDEFIDLKREPKSQICFYKPFCLYDIAMEIVAEKKFVSQHNKLYFYNSVYWEQDENFLLFSRYYNNYFYDTIYERMCSALKIDPTIHQDSVNNSSKENKRKRKSDTQLGEAELLLKFVRQHQSNYEKQLINTRSFTSAALAKCVVQNCCNHSLVFNKNPFLFCFKNKIYDLENNTWVQPSPELFISQTCGYNYEKDLDLSKNKIELMDIFKTIIPYEPDLQIALKYLSTGLSGELIEKLVCFSGSGRNGKGLLQEFNKIVLGNYFYFLGPSSIQSETRSGSIDQSLANIHEKRFIVISEPNADKKISTSIVKTLTGCSTINARALYSTNTNIKNVGTYILECNQRPKLDQVETAITQRMFVIHFPVTFVDKSVYDTLDKEEQVNFGIVKTEYKSIKFLEKYKTAYFHILLDFYKIYKSDNSFLLSKESPSFQITQEYFQESDYFVSWFNENYEKVEIQSGFTVKQVEDTIIQVKQLHADYKCFLIESNELKIPKLCEFRRKLSSCPILGRFYRFDTTWKSIKVKNHVIVSHKKKISH